MEEIPEGQVYVYIYIYIYIYIYKTVRWNEVLLIVTSLKAIIRQDDPA